MKKSSVPLAFHRFWNTRTCTGSEKHLWRSAFQGKVYKGEKPSYWFNKQLKLLGYQKNTQRMLTSCIEEFLYKISQHGITEVREITRRDIKNYYEYINQRPGVRTKAALSSSMINTHLYAVRLFFQFLQESGEITKNPMSSLMFPKPENAIREILTPLEIKKLYSSSNNLLDKALLSVLYGCGLRASEAISLNRYDLHFKGNKLYVREGKGKQRREVPFTESVKRNLEDYYYNERPQSLKSGSKEQEAFFVGRKGERITYQYLWRHFSNLVISAGINKNVSPHSLRHSIATHLLERGMNIEYVREFLGHQQLESTQIYTRVNKKVRL